MSDPGKYRTPQELEERKKKDPIRVAREKLLKLKAKDAEIDALEEKIDAEIAEAVKFSEESEPAKESSIYEWVYAPAPWLEKHPPGRRR
jgi:pyruvate dehydrogenase E1 component alpha subunit